MSSIGQPITSDPLATADPSAFLEGLDFAARKLGEADAAERISDDEMARLVELSIRVTAQDGYSGDDDPIRPSASEGVLLAEFPAAYCPPIGKAYWRGSVGIIEGGGVRRQAVFMSDAHDANGRPIGGPLDFQTGVKAKRGGRLDLRGGYYLIIGGGKSSAKALLIVLGLA